MELYWKVIAAVFTALILCTHIGKQEKEFASLVAMAVCCMGTVAALTFLRPIMEMIREMEAMTNIEHDILQILLKSTGIALVAELSALICQDAGYTAMARTVQMLGCTVILYLSVPVISMLLNLIRDILGVL